MERQVLTSFIDDLCAACQYRTMFINRIFQDDFCFEKRIFQSDMQSGGFLVVFDIGGWQTGQAGLSGEDLMTFIKKLNDPAAVFLFKINGGGTHIALERRREFLLDVFKRECTVVLEYIDRHAALYEFEKMIKAVLIMDPFSGVKLTDLTVWKNF